MIATETIGGADLALILASVSAVIWLYLALFRGRFWLANQRLSTEHAQLDTWPDIAIVIPARNEQGVIKPTLTSFQNQDYPGYLSIIVVDDNSEDGTVDDIKHSRDTKTELLQGRAVPAGWTGKLWALQQGIDEILLRKPLPAFFLFSDADIIHPKESVRQLVLHAEERALELVSLMVRLNCRSKWEMILIPAFVFFFQKLYPFPWINNPSCKTAGAAGGCILIRTATLLQAGGLEKIKNQVIDDCALAQLIKPHGSIWVGLTQEVISHRPYASLKEIWNMVIRTAFNQLHHSACLLALSCIGMILTYVIPPAVFVVGAISLNFLLIAIGGVVWAIMILCYAPTLRLYTRRPLEALLLPIAALMYTLMTIDSAQRFWRHKNPTWKGRANQIGGARKP